MAKSITAVTFPWHQDPRAGAGSHTTKVGDDEAACTTSGTAGWHHDRGGARRQRGATPRDPPAPQSCRRVPLGSDTPLRGGPHY